MSDDSSMNALKGTLRRARQGDCREWLRHRLHCNGVMAEMLAGGRRLLRPLEGKARERASASRRPSARSTTSDEAADSGRIRLASVLGGLRRAGRVAEQGRKSA